MQRNYTILMGVSGCGKSTVAAALAERLGVEAVLEADSFHSAVNKEKMRAGIPLTDDDREPWLRLINDKLCRRSETLVIATCSALKRRYRDILARNLVGNVIFVCLSASRETLFKRLEEREHEFMSPTLLDSQLATLEIPGEDENGLVVNVEGELSETVTEIVRRLQNQGVEDAQSTSGSRTK